MSLAVVLAGALRNALLAYDRATWEKAFPASSLLLYGAFFTIAFAAVYMPTLLTWRSRARELVDAVYRTPGDGKPDEAWMKGRAALEQLLGINIGLMAQLSACSPSSVHSRRASSPDSSPSSRAGSRSAQTEDRFTPSLWHLRNRTTSGKAG